MAKKRELDYAELKAEYNKLLNDINDYKLMGDFKENKELKEQIEKYKRIIVKLQRRNRELNLLLQAKIERLKND